MVCMMCMIIKCTLCVEFDIFVVYLLAYFLTEECLMCFESSEGSTIVTGFGGIGFEPRSGSAFEIGADQWGFAPDSSISGDP